MKNRYTYRGHEVLEALVDAKLADAGFTRVDKIADAEIVLTYFTNIMSLENAYYEDEGILKSAAPGALLVDLSAETPMFARELFAIADASNFLFAEAPIMVLDGCVDNAFADKANVACFLAAEEMATEEVLPVLQALAGAIHETTGPGSASMSRAAYTLQTVAAMTAAIEADALYRAVRMMPAGMGEAAMGNAGAISPLADSLLRAVDEGRFTGTYSIEMVMGELAAAMTTAEEAEITLPQAESCLQLLEILAIIGGADNSPAALAMAFRDQSEVEAIGLDWRRAAQMSETYVHTHEEDDEDYDEYFDDGDMDDGGLGDYLDDYDEEFADDINLDRLKAKERDAIRAEKVRAKAEEASDFRSDDDRSDNKGVASSGHTKPQVAADDDEDYGYEDDDPGYDEFEDREYIDYADQEDDFDENDDTYESSWKGR